MHFTVKAQRHPPLQIDAPSHKAAAKQYVKATGARSTTVLVSGNGTAVRFTVASNGAISNELSRYQA